MNNYEDLLSSNEILSPPKVHEISDMIKAKQQPILDRRKALFDHVQRLAAPSATKQATYDWFQKIRAVQAEQEALYKHFLALIHAAYRNGVSETETRYFAAAFTIHHAKARPRIT